MGSLSEDRPIILLRRQTGIQSLLYPEASPHQIEPLQGKPQLGNQHPNNYKAQNPGKDIYPILNSNLHGFHIHLYLRSDCFILVDH